MSRVPNQRAFTSLALTATLSTRPHVIRGENDATGGGDDVGRVVRPLAAQRDARPDQAVGGAKTKLREW